MAYILYHVRKCVSNYLEKKVNAKIASRCCQIVKCYTDTFKLLTLSIGILFYREFTCYDYIAYMMSSQLTRLIFERSKFVIKFVYITYMIHSSFLHPSIRKKHIVKLRIYLYLGHIGTKYLSWYHLA